MKTNYSAPKEENPNEVKIEANRKPFVYTEKELGAEIVQKGGNNPHINEAPKRLVYYSKTFNKTK